MTHTTPPNEISFRRIRSLLPRNMRPETVWRWQIELYEPRHGLEHPSAMAFVSDRLRRIEEPAKLEAIAILVPERRDELCRKLLNSCRDRWKRLVVSDAAAVVLDDLAGV